MGRLTKRFVKASLIAEQADDINAAANYALNAAWTADDASDCMSATSCRQRAAPFFEDLLKGTDHSVEAAISIRTQMVDIFRRSEQWKKSISLAQTTLAQNVDPTIKAVLEFGTFAALGRDSNCYTMEEVIEEK